MKLIKKHTTSKGNKLSFYSKEFFGRDQVIVIDNSCQMERTYTIGAVKELDDFEDVLIHSVDQVINAWIEERVWF